MKKGSIALAALGLGAGAMYLADPQEGRRRRARLRDAAVHASRTVKTSVGAASHDLQNRAAGLAARVRGAMREAPPPADEVLAARVRTRLGRLVSHPGSIDVKAASGWITLTGLVLQAEVEPLIRGICDIPGVTHVENHLELHATAGNVPGLQGRKRASARRRRLAPLGRHRPRA